MKQTQTNQTQKILKYFVRTPYDVKLKIIPNMTKRGKLPATGMKITDKVIYSVNNTAYIILSIL
jgi:hypothetical protein